MTHQELLTADVIRTAVTNYLDAVSSGPSSTIAALYAEDATLEDPVGGEVRVGREAIEAFYGALDCKTELLTIRVSGNNAAFHFRVVTEIGGKAYAIEPIDVMTFDDRGAITSMRAYWSPTDMTEL
jgi:steroid delta-isomerase